VISVKYLASLIFLLAAFHAEAVFAHASLDELIEYTSDLVRGQPENPQALLNRARFELKQGDHAGALSDIETAERLSDRIEVSYVLGLYFVAEQQHQQAIGAFGDYLARYPGHTPAIQARAKAYEKLGETEKSIYDYQYLLSVSREPSPDYYIELARLESVLGPCGLHMALKSLDRGIAKLGVLVSLQSAAIDYEIDRGNYRLALARHETLRPWLGKTSQWQDRQRQLSEKLSSSTSGSINTVE
jgi:tetratricopeptide (TPR) repeat protein